MSGGPSDPGPGGVDLADLGVDGLPLVSTASLLFLGTGTAPCGAGVEELELVPLWGLTGSFLWLFIPRSSPFSFGGVLPIPFIVSPFPFCNGVRNVSSIQCN